MTNVKSDAAPEQTQWFTERSSCDGSGITLQISALLHSEQTPYQKIDIYQTKTFGKLLVIDDVVMLTTRDNFIYHEMMTHPVLFNHPQPRRVAIVGGGDCGSLREVAKHDCVEQIIQIEIDERVTRLSEQYFPELCTANQDRRVELQFCDAIAWMKTVPADSLDVIIVDSTDPIGPAEGLFQAAFYHDCARALKHNGLLIQQSESPLLHWQSISLPMQAAMKQAHFKSTRSLFFPQPVYPSGWWSATIAAREDIHLVRDAEAKNPPFKTDYYNYGIHLAAFSTPNFLID
ncbi:MAG: polyamine aminopropyltransferase [Candidatus Thioglobus sp.]|nr:MAG: polyamine aminopropyltransferase [Candidatus Thioglobus sp.]